MDQGVFAIFSRKGERIYAGTPRGKIVIYDAKTLEAIETVTVATGNQCGIKSIAFSRSGDAYVVRAPSHTHACSPSLSLFPASTTRQD
jgi:hypothetical protein